MEDSIYAHIYRNASFFHIRVDLSKVVCIYINVTSQNHIETIYGLEVDFIRSNNYKRKVFSSTYI